MPDLRAAATAATAAVLLGVLAGCGGDSATLRTVTGATDAAADGYHGAVLDQPYRMEPVTLTDSRGEEVALHEALDGPLTLVFFGYTHCPDICQAVMADLASTVARLDEDDRDRVQVWFVTTDPARDDPAVLRAYLDRFDPAFEGFTGPLDDIVAVAQSLHVAIEEGPRLPSGGYEVTHGTPVLGVQPAGSVPILWTEGTSAAKLAEDVQRILDQGGVG